MIAAAALHDISIGDEKSCATVVAPGDNVGAYAEVGVTALVFVSTVDGLGASDAVVHCVLP